jgi:hypothetical protein
MKKNPFYSLQIISGKAYLLPLGQAVASHMPGIQLGGSGEMLWSLMDQCNDREELIRLAVSSMDVRGADTAEVEADLDQFIGELESLGILENENVRRDAAEHESRYAYLKAGPLRVELRGKSEFFHSDFAPFLIMTDDGRAADQTVTVTELDPPDHAGLTCLLQNSELEVYSGDDRILLRFPTMPDISACTLSPDGAEAVFYVRSSNEMEELRFSLFHAIRHAFLYLAQRLGLFVLHAVSVLYRDRIWLFSAPAGTGKSTHAKLWQSLFGAPVINGDLAMLSVSENGPVSHPIPWCGTSGITVDETHPLGGVVFLRRGQDNSAVVLPAEARQLRLANRLISPVWTRAQLTDNLAFADTLSAQTVMWELTCTPEPEAAFCIKAAIDRYLEEDHING